ncbi:MAG: carbohydrate binding family 9 domain-containing protein [Rhodothermales bacterium]|nr:carbohydrate binding family 9 domain-containing protein [Rhodothermales bacterium]MBO6779299.1 carbohydrate binding family 9 domain-containing protein [Rhodothermales bacterium]
MRPALLVFLAVLTAAPALAQNHATHRWTAVRVEEAPRIDGNLGDAVWQQIEPITEFIQVWPEDGSPATERSEVRIAYDRDNLYFAFKFYDSEPELIRAKNLERGGRNDRDDHAYIALDTYQDGRNAYLFEMNALGTQDDATITDEGLTLDSFSWDAVFRSETVIDDEGWSMEVSIPFRQLRFPKGDEVEFGLMLSRMVNRKNERSLWPAIGLEFGNSFSVLSAVSQYGTLTGIRDVRRGKNIEIKPYVITGAQTNRPDLAFEATESDFTRDFGVDLKYGIRSDLTLDLTVNTDFAQVEADNVQLDLSRFSLFFPEKREFFLERSGLFQHGNPRSTQTFFSRRIGLSDQILTGARLTGQIGRFSVGMLNIETGEDMGDLFGSASANNTVVRARTSLGSRATAGGIVTNLERADGTFNRALGIDAQRRFWGASSLTGWLATVQDSDPSQEDWAGHVALRVGNDTYGGNARFTTVGENYRPALGFVRRRDLREYYVRGNYQPVVSFESLPFIRRFDFEAEYQYIEGQDGEKQTTEFGIQGRVEGHRRDRVEVEYERVFERLTDSFFIRPDAEILPGDYTYGEYSISAGSDQSRRFFAGGSVSTSGFFDGTRTNFTADAGFRHSQYLTIEGGIRHSVIDLPIDNGRFDATVISSSILAAASRNLFAKALIQYDNFSRDLQANIRVDWIHTPGSDLFFVFNTAYHFAGDDEVLFDPRANLLLTDRVAVAKLTYLILL